MGRAGYEAEAIYDRDATMGRVRAEIKRAASALKAGDWFVLSYSGHGSQRDCSWAMSRTTESLCCYDGLVDDVWFRRWLGGFESGVNVVVILDSCFSGGMDKASGRRVRVAPMWVVRKLRAGAAQGEPEEKGLKSNLTLLSACDVDETAEDGELNGAFTGALVRSATGGKQTWAELYAATAGWMSRTTPRQRPQMVEVSGESLGGREVFA